MDLGLVKVRSALGAALAWPRWVRAGFAMPAPRGVKWKVLRRYTKPGGTWIESGTYLGSTTRYLARESIRVFTIEPSDALAGRATRLLARRRNIEVVHGLSEVELPLILQRVEGPTYFWLDGHASGGFTYSGPLVTPIREELAAIESAMERLDSVSVFVDDWRGFGSSDGEDGAYPSRYELIDWARRNGLRWTVEMDIFVAWR